MPLMRSQVMPVTEIDWSVMVHRQDVSSDSHPLHTGQDNVLFPPMQMDMKAMNSGREEERDDFDTRISGPWMLRWPIRHHNKHTALAAVTDHLM